MSSSVPTKFGKCNVVKMLGQGATAVVYLARHEGLDIPVAIKVLRRGLSRRRPEYAERFLREAKMAAWLEHPNIVRVIDCGVQDDYHYMVMDYVDGPNCLERLQDNPEGLDWRESADVVLQAAQGLAYAARKDVIHRDVKPSNLMIDSEGRVRVTDLGLAKLTIKGMVSLTQELHTVGTPNYMSPEQVKSSSGLDRRADIYSLGATFYHMVTGRAPFSGRNPMQVVAKHLSAPLEPPFRVKPSLPADLSTVICKMMAKDPADRYQDYETLTEDLDNLLEGRAISAAGFSETQLSPEDEAELHKLLDDLNFAQGFLIEDEEEPIEPEPGEPVPDPEIGSSELALFGPDDFTSYEADEDDTGGSTVMMPKSGRRSSDSTALVVGLILVAFVAVAIIAVLLIVIRS